MKSVWLVGKGEYSDYGIVAIFSTEEKAKAAIKVQNEEVENEWDQWDHDPYEMEVDEAVGAKYLTLYGVHMDQYGVSKKDDCPYKVFVKPRYTNLRIITTREGCGEATCDIYAQSAVSQDHAHKIAVEARQKWLREEALSRVDN